MDEGVTGGGVWMGVTGAGIWVSLNERCGVVLLEEGWVGAIEGWGGVGVIGGGSGGVLLVEEVGGYYWRRVG